jgi:flagellar basal body-associated protein FliL
MENQIPTQSQFTANEPLIAQDYLRSEKDLSEEQPKQTDSQKLLKIGIVIGGVIILLLLMTLIFYNPGQQPTDEQPEDPELVEQLSPEVSLLQSRVRNLRTQLEQADPVRSDLPFPPVDVQLRLDDKR